ncbi:phosphatidate cytidylyltransferase [Allocatelliglobosispora scoriae]|uniref:Phosphatidate cytidylyltransferase n=1 Tax=Allocatelliglobosispora scoriae TaxID=643052 RepID=A0A841C012_9ACTN|nr:phosphatidate cytidylyltransferase [Allocatelliglobosispora scoriae]MBB5872241.1 phosphatidate cytidylyltransferase [Allocatelliglobosispora scoriae]
MSEDDRRDPGYGSGASAYSRLGGLDDADAGGGFFARGEDVEPPRPPRGQAPGRSEETARPSRSRRDSGARAPQEQPRRDTGRPEPSAWEEPPRRGAAARGDEPTRGGRPSRGQYETPGGYEHPRADDTAERPAYPAEEQQSRGGRSGRRRAPAGEPAPLPVERKSRAGRNVPVSIGVGILLAAVVLGTLFFYKQAFLGVLIIAGAVGSWELIRAIRTTGAQPPMVPVIGGGAVMIALAWFSGLDALSLGLLIAVLATFVWRIGDGPEGYQRDMGASALILAYVPFLLSFGAIMATPDDGKWRILCLLAAVVLSDTGGFVAGVFLGKHPMAPTISPKKSWEGFAGSLIATALGSSALLYFLLDVDLWKGLVFGLAVSIACVLGDLAESLLKRDLGIKDMSNLLPGHGGMMDRLDSIVFALPTAYVLLSVLVPTA